MDDGFLVTIKSQPKHGVLYAFYKSCGTYETMQDVMGFASCVLVSWVNLRSYPKKAFGPGWERYKEKLESSLQTHLGISASECWPQELREFIDKTKELKSLVFEQTEEVSLRRLTTSMEKRLLTGPTQETYVSLLETKDKIREVVKTLPGRERKVIELRYGINDGITYTLLETAAILKVTKERVRQIEAKAICCMQQPKRAQRLLELLD